MKTIIGLFSKEKHITRSLSKLKEFGIPQENIDILAYENNVRELLNGYRGQVTTRYARWSLLLSIVVFGLYNLVGWICDCGLIPYNLRVELDSLGIIVIVGALLGILGAYFFGIEILDGSSRLYIWNIHQGGKVVVVQTDKELTERIKDILHKENGVAIQTLESRFERLLHKKSSPAFF